jgi:acyl-coenzyme A synthetase/AMP-(fatty) acid ligase
MFAQPSGVGAGFGEAMPVVDRIYAHALATPQKTAVVHNGRRVSYRQFAAGVSLARRFLERRAVSRDRVAVLCVHNLFDAWILRLALGSLGVTTVSARSVEDIALLGLGQVSIVSAPARTDAWAGLARAAAAGGHSLIIVPADVYSGWEAVDFRDAEAIAATVPGGQILLTSGTTGAYKKVLIDSANEASNVPLRIDILGLRGESVVNVFNFPAWTAIGYQWPVCAWSLGAGVVIHGGKDRHRSLAIPGLTHAFIHPQMLAELLAELPETFVRNDAMALIVGGGVLSVGQWRAACERLTSDVRTIIGSTEIGTFSLTPITNPDDLAWHRVLPALQVQVVDDQSRPSPAGETGLVRIRTTGVEGYLDDPEATRTFFRDGYFYPGDLGALREDGRLSLQGRVTDVINVWGHKIATLPVETSLQDRLGAEAICVFSVPGENGEVVHIAIQSERTIEPADLRTALEAALPGVRQVRVHLVGALPRNHMGKIERGKLKATLLS